MNLREWLIVVGIVIIAGILIDGLRRMWLSRQDSLKMSRDLGGHIENSPLDDDFNPELPSGGARVVGSSSESMASDSATPEVAKEFKETEDAKEPSSASSEPARVRIEPKIKDLSASSELFDTDSLCVDEESGITAADVDRTTPDIKAGQRNAAGRGAAEQEGVVSAARVVRKAASLTKSRKSKVEGVKHNDSASEGKQGRISKKGKRTENKRDASTDANGSGHEVIVIHVDAKPGTQFSGVAIKGLLEACGLEHGDMSIFHRHEENDLLSSIQFSVANAVEPGYFDPETIDDLLTPGVSFFMSIPGPKDYQQAFKYMHETAKCFADNLQGELKDENRSVLTSQTIEHCKQRIRDFERKQLCKTRV